MPKTIFITGCSSGIGLATAKLFHDKGWNVIATMRSTKNSSLLNLSPNLLLCELDVSNRSTFQPAIDAAIAAFGSIDVLVNNAGYGQYGVFETLSDEAIRRQFEVNLFGPMRLIQLLLPHFRANGSGTIINVSSGAGLFGLPFLSMYNSSKFALEGFTESISYELRAVNVAVKSVIPYAGITNTNFAKTAMAGAQADAEGIGAYAPYMQKITGSMRTRASQSVISSDDVAEKIWEAVTDENDTLRYFIGKDDAGYLKARYESNSDEEYMQFMRRQFDTA